MSKLVKHMKLKLCKKYSNTPDVICSPWAALGGLGLFRALFSMTELPYLPTSGYSFIMFIVRIYLLFSCKVKY